ncbi:hypothetical protein J6590_027328 [Homalodisca vitripennis]|nr:hypothetical protein J6590_027328 [Homalodisca vitripennis]
MWRSIVVELRCGDRPLRLAKFAEMWCVLEMGRCGACCVLEMGRSIGVALPALSGSSARYQPDKPYQSRHISAGNRQEVASPILTGN